VDGIEHSDEEKRAGEKGRGGRASDRWEERSLSEPVT